MKNVMRQVLQATLRANIRHVSPAPMPIPAAGASCQCPERCKPTRTCCSALQREDCCSDWCYLTSREVLPPLRLDLLGVHIQGCTLAHPSRATLRWARSRRTRCTSTPGARACPRRMLSAGCRPCSATSPRRPALEVVSCRRMAASRACICESCMHARTWRRVLQSDFVARKECVVLW